MTTGEAVWGSRQVRRTGPAVGAWAFRQRSWLPVLPALPLLFAPPSRPTLSALVAGLLFAAAGQALRFWAVRHIGVISRTRATRIGPLITSGPYAAIRNPLYVGNWLLWTGFVIGARVFWMLPIAWAAFALQYGAIAQWEEEFLAAQGPTHAAYVSSVGRWLPRPRAAAAIAGPTRRHGWRDVLFSERGTLLAEAAMLALLAVKEWWL
jgi:protein-S-isoprenylcysteine O-methyltransferase Ste14